ncbi:phosphatase PAP2 family protein [Clostridium sp. SYSU_GA19001]|uniref:phosphatase PAP2 family protein n=1 Tax=Clostridium caldaquaticum TaxID=2940653 RepID=UPI00207792D1|nr:phosphatase PAP2 family protein [Clostridium caldaquaticum]MCM8711838.1 phosphatase PAP2 family protein [Clostridium caldaquaticum]
MEKVVSSKEKESIKKIKENLLAASAMLFIVPLNIFYVLLNNSKRGVYSLVTKLDKAIPFMKVFIIPYIVWYVFIFLVMAYLCIKDKKTYFVTVVSYNLGLIACYITFFFFQTTVPRPELVGSDILTKLMSIIYSADQPYNCFPSIHVLTSYLMIKAVMASNIKSKSIISAVWFCSIIIIISTLFVKQHVILDVVSGIVYADLIFRVSEAYSGRVYFWIKKQIILFMMKKKLEV